MKRKWPQSLSRTDEILLDDILIFYGYFYKGEGEDGLDDAA